jgi:predicted glutamine amidotransferase
MCELFGASAARPQELVRWLEPFRARGGTTAENPDGWRIASWTTGTLQLEKAPEFGAHTERFADLARRLRGEISAASEVFGPMRRPRDVQVTKAEPR